MMKIVPNIRLILAAVVLRAGMVFTVVVIVVEQSVAPIVGAVNADVAV